MTRLFVAFWPSDEARRFLRGINLPGAARPVPERNWHVTLRFLGDADPDAVIAALAPTELPSVTATYTTRLLAIGGWAVAARVDGVDALAAAVADATAAVDRDRDKAAFRGHLTLGRVSRPPQLPQSTSDATLTQVVDAIHLVESVLDPAGSIYSTLSTFVTAGGAR